MLLNFNMTCIRNAILCMAVSILLSCVNEDMGYGSLSGPSLVESCVMTVELEVPESKDMTRSSFTDEQLNRIYTLNVFIFHEGRLLKDCCRYFTDISSMTLTLPCGMDGFNIYIVGNVLEMEPPVNEVDMEKVRLLVGDYEDFRVNGFPVAACFTGYEKGDLAHFKLKRLTGQYNISMRTSATDAQYLIKDVRLMNCARDMYPFSEATKACEMARSGDALTLEDLEHLNAGEAVPLYFVENLQGVLLPDNKDKKKKIPSRLDLIEDGIAGRCTYIEITADVLTPAARYSDAKYRFYMGQDQTSDFNIKRNTLYNVTLDFTQNMVNEEEWRIEADEPVLKHEIKCSLEDEQIVFYPQCDKLNDSAVHPIGGGTGKPYIVYHTDVYLYCETEDINKIFPEKMIKIGNEIIYDYGFRVEYNGHNPPDRSNTAPIECFDGTQHYYENHSATYKGHEAIKFRISNYSAINTYGDAVVEPISLDAEDERFYSGDIRIYSAETYNGRPVFDKTYKNAVAYTQHAYPLLFKIEKSDEDNSYYLVVRGLNPARVNLTFNCTFWNATTKKVLPEITTADIHRSGTRLQKLEGLTDISKLAKLEIDVSGKYNNTGIGSGEKAYIGPYDTMIPYNINFKNGSSLHFYNYNKTYDRWERINTQYTQKRVGTEHLVLFDNDNYLYDSSYCDINIDKLSSELNNDTKKYAGDMYNASPFYFLNGCMLAKDLAISTHAAGKLSTNATWKGFYWYFAGPGRDLFDDPAIRSLFPEHKIGMWIKHWYKLGGDYTSELQSKYYSGAPYMTINGMHEWAYGDRSEDGYLLE